MINKKDKELKKTENFTQNYSQDSGEFKELIQGSSRGSNDIENSKQGFLNKIKTNQKTQELKQIEEIGQAPGTPEISDNRKMRTNFPEREPSPKSQTQQRFEPQPDKLLPVYQPMQKSPPPEMPRLQRQPREIPLTRTNFPEVEPSPGSQTEQEAISQASLSIGVSPSTPTLKKEYRSQTIYLTVAPVLLALIAVALILIKKREKKREKKPVSLFTPFHLYGNKAKCGTWLVATRNLPEIDEDLKIFTIARVVGIVNEVQHTVILEIFLDKFYIFKSKNTYMSPFLKLPRTEQIWLTFKNFLSFLPDLLKSDI